MSQQPESERRVTPLELLFDLVFAFGFTQVTTLLSDDPSWSGVGKGLLIITALWWAWSSYAWLTSTVDTDNGRVSAAMLVAMAAMFVAALAVPYAFGRQGSAFGVAFLIVNIMFLALFALATRNETEQLAAILRIVPIFLMGATLITVAGFVHGTLRPALWLLALIVGLFGPLLRGTTGWRLEAAHFIERHGLIVIIAIGESLIAIGIGARNTQLSAGVIVAAVLGLVVVISFWLAYFDFFPLRARQLLAGRSGGQRTALARDVFTYLHLPMVAGIILFAFAMRATLVHIGSVLNTVRAFGLTCGPALYLFAFVGLRFRVSRSLGRGRLAAAVICASLLPVARVVPGLAAVALVAVVLVVLHAYELIWWRDARAELRASGATKP
ncbi:MAG TPA: low temperature requirement protein A [Acidimicrobiales bacterium]|nr:low temperature requirement protein A [Acidimicrobiales bacterium]